MQKKKEDGRMKKKKKGERVRESILRANTKTAISLDYTVGLIWFLDM
jgi:hypothetical protein